MSDNKQTAAEIVEKVKELVQKGNATRIEVIRNGQVIVNFPLNVGIVVGVAAAPWALLLAVIATLGCDCSVDVIKDDGEVIHIA